MMKLTNRYSLKIGFSPITEENEPSSEIFSSLKEVEEASKLYKEGFWIPNFYIIDIETGEKPSWVAPSTQPELLLRNFESKVSQHPEAYDYDGIEFDRKNAYIMPDVHVDVYARVDSYSWSDTIYDDLTICKKWHGDDAPYELVYVLIDDHTDMIPSWVKSPFFKNITEAISLCKNGGRFALRNCPSGEVVGYTNSFKEYVKANHYPEKSDIRISNEVERLVQTAVDNGVSPMEAVRALQLGYRTDETGEYLAFREGMDAALALVKIMKGGK